jgi:hypothetical protein
MRRIESMSEDIKELLTRIKCSPKFALQIDESIDVTVLAQLLVFVRYCFEENIQEEFMFCLPLSERCTLLRRSCLQVRFPMSEYCFFFP